MFAQSDIDDPTFSLQRSGSPTADEGSSWKGYHHGSEQMQVCDKTSLYSVKSCSLTCATRDFLWV